MMKADKVSLDVKLSDRYFTEGKKIAVALSGGADSVCLIHLMEKLSKERNFKLFALHLNHNIRGEEAKRDALFCERLCKGLSVEFICASEDVPMISKETGKSLEEAARDARYSFFSREMQKRNIDVLATAHNADDNAETILLRLIRGTSLDGICGIPKERSFADGRMIVRPILSAKKADILDFCLENNFEFVIDSTNACTDYPRNRVRKQIIPEILEINPSFFSVNARNAEIFKRDSDYISSVSEKLLRDASFPDGGLSTEKLLMEHPAVRTRAVRSWCERCGAFPENVHVEKICSLLEEGNNFSVCLPKKKKAVFENGVLALYDDIRGKAKFEGYSVRVGEGETIVDMPNFGITISVVLTKLEDGADLIIREEKYSLKQSLIYNLSTHKVLKFDTINGELFMRTKRPGDVLDLGTFRKELRRLMSEKKIPSALRSVLPCFEDAGGLCYVPFVASAKRATAGDGQNYSVKVNISFDTTKL